MLLIVGLGNPGMKYKNTYHNVGFDLVDALAKSLKIKFDEAECEAKTARAIVGGEDVVLAKPQTYMNLSGVAVKKLVKHYGVDATTELIVCYDDVDLPLGSMRMRESGSAGTHNGMRSIVSELGTQDFKRLRIGTRTDELKNKEVELIDFVLSKVDYDSKQILDKTVKSAADLLFGLVKGEDFARVEEKINKYHD
ncbi:MAG: aminoacyl-tRNA hydrolase [Clostridia bacterium]|nr:aminoacyl-tRNA hydrolase [Clostridia bacterium]